MAKNTNPNTENILKDLLSGQSLREVGERYGLTKQRVSQIANRHHLPSTVEIKRKLKQEKYFLKWGVRDVSDLYVACRTKFHRKRTNCLNSGQEWSIHFGQIEWVTTCPVLGIELDYFAEQRQENSPSFDKVDPKKGYVPGNVQIISWRANRIKNDGTSEEHEKIAQYIRERQEIL